MPKLTCLLALFSSGCAPGDGEGSVPLRPCVCLSLAYHWLKIGMP